MLALGRNHIAALGCAAIAAALLGLTFGFEQVPESITRGMGPEIFPRLVLGVIFVLCLLLAFEPAEPKAAEPVAAGRLVATSAALVAFMGVLEITGMLPAMLIFLLACGWMWGERRLWLLVPASLGVTAAIWAVFVKGFGVQLPAGMLGRWAGL